MICCNVVDLWSRCSIRDGQSKGLALQSTRLEQPGQHDVGRPEVGLVPLENHGHGQLPGLVIDLHLAWQQKASQSIEMGPATPALSSHPVHTCEHYLVQQAQSAVLERRVQCAKRRRSKGLTTAELRFIRGLA